MPPVTINGVLADLRNETLRRMDDTEIVLRPQAFTTLRHLVENANRLVSKGELMAVVWPGIAVTDDSLVQCIHEIRRAIGDEARDVLQTVTRRGYRLVLPEPDADFPRGAAIAVLPFVSVEQPDGRDDFADGLIDELITAMSRVSGLAVVSRSASVRHRPHGGDVRAIAAELGVRYLLEGSIRRSGARLRITADLVDGVTATLVWADRFEGSAEDVFDLQDRLIEQIVGVIEPSVRRAEIERARRKRPESLDAYDLYLQALPNVMSNTEAGAEHALHLLDRALVLDPGYLPAHGHAAWCHEQRYFRGGFDPADRQAALAHADVTLAVNADDPQAMSIGAFVRANLTRDYDAAVAVLDRALAMNGNSALALGFSALVSAHSERDARAVEHARRALRLSPPDDPLNYHPFCALAVTSLFARRHAEAAAYASQTVRANPGFSVPYAYLVAAQVSLGNLESARSAGRRLLEIAPGFTVDGFVRMDLFRPELTESIASALRRAGLPGT